MQSVETPTLKSADRCEIVPALHVARRVAEALAKDAARSLSAPDVRYPQRPGSLQSKTV
jgi:DNA segregation ATPase FtsK/SpoIIIE-like protein